MYHILRIEKIVQCRKCYFKFIYTLILSQFNFSEVIKESLKIHFFFLFRTLFPFFISEQMHYYAYE